MKGKWRNDKRIHLKLMLDKMATTFKKYLFFFLALGGLLISSTRAQDTFDKSDYRIRFGFDCTKQPDNSRVFQASFVAANRKDRKVQLPIYEAEVRFVNYLEDQEVELGTAKTTREGIAEITVPSDHTYLTDEEGFMNFRAVFDGGEALDAETEELRIRDLRLDLNLVEIDSVKTVVVNAYAKDSLGADTPVSDAYIRLSLDGMIAPMLIGEEFIEDGELQVKFPEGMPGDIAGNVTVFAKIDDNDTFGNVVQSQSIGWGTPKEILAEQNKLWSEAAPIWMYVVLTILLVGVWANYAYTIINLFKIKKEGKKIALQSEEAE